MLLALCLLPVSCWAFWKYESSEWKKRISSDLELVKQFDRAGSDAAEKAVVDALISVFEGCRRMCADIPLLVM